MFSPFNVLNPPDGDKVIAGPYLFRRGNVLLIKQGVDDDWFEIFDSKDDAIEELHRNGLNVDSPGVELHTFDSVIHETIYRPQSGRLWRPDFIID